MSPINASDWTSILLFGLLDFALRATVVLSGAWVATKLLRRASAATRHLIWTAAIAGVLVLPLLGRTLPAWNVPTPHRQRSIRRSVNAWVSATGSVFMAS